MSVTRLPRIPVGGEPRGGPIPRGMRDDGPPHRGLLCLGPTGDWLCRLPAGNAHSHHIPYVEGEYLTAIQPGMWP